METKINIARLLKDKPQGTKLYDWLHNIDVELDTISTTDTETVVWCTNETNNNTTCHRGYSEFGTERGYPDGLQILFPSKEMRDWAKFSWKKGDVLVNEDGSVHIIFEEFEDDAYTMFSGKYYYSKDGKKAYSYFRECDDVITEEFTIETEDAAQTYISAIEERLCGKLNLQTLEIEKQLEFKDGDIVVYGKSVAICRKIYKHTLSFYVSLNEMFGLLFADEVESSEEYRFATEEEKQQLFDALEKKGKAWNAEKKEFIDLRPKVEFKPFDKVLGRNEKCEVWEAELFSHYKEESRYPFCCIGFSRKYCIPYNKETAHLLGTTDDWEGGEQ
jgi:hypothetical protein